MRSFQSRQPRQALLSTPPVPTSRLLQPFREQTARRGHSLEQMAIFPPTSDVNGKKAREAESSAPMQRATSTTQTASTPSSSHAVPAEQRASTQRTAPPGHSFKHISLFPPEKKNRTGLPDTLKTGIERCSGFSLDDVQVFYNSSKPAEVQALAYTQGTQIHVGPGQEQHLAHEAWHVVQQMQGRVQPTDQMKNGMMLNDSPDLESEAETFGTRAMAGTSASPPVVARQKRELTPVVQRIIITKEDIGKNFQVQDDRGPQVIRILELIDVTDKRATFKTPEGTLDVAMRLIVGRALPGQKSETDGARAENVMPSAKEFKEEGAIKTPGEGFEKGETVIVKDEEGDYEAIFLGIEEEDGIQFALISEQGVEGKLLIEDIRKKGASAREERPVKRIGPGGVTIYHSHKRDSEPNAAEYIAPGGDIDVTSHGLGSGIYGFAAETEEERDEVSRTAIKYGSIVTPFTVRNPFYLQDIEHGTLFTSVSKELQSLSEALVSGSQSGINEALLASASKIEGLEKRFMKLFQRAGAEFPSGTLSQAVFAFLKDYLSGKKEPIEQPINYVLRLLGYDGVYATNPVDNRFQRGNVKFVKPDMRIERKISEIRD